MLHRARHALAQIIARLPLLSLPAPAVQLALPAPAPDPSRPRPEDHLSIPIVEFTKDDRICRTHQDRGQFLARQDRWRELADEIRAADIARSKTPGGMPVAELLAYGARADVVHAVEHALIDGRPSKDAPLIDGIMGLEAVRAEYRGDAYISLIVALAHIDIAWAWRGTGWDTIVPKFNRGRCAAHFDRAKALLAPYSGDEMDSPLVGAACCALLTSRSDPAHRIANDYERLIDLDPHNHRHMRAFGNHMLPRWFGSYQDLELEARRTAARTQDIWGNGAYTWVCFDAIAMDEDACARIDVDFFVDGLKDIAKRRPEQEMINLLAAYCAVALRNGLGMSQDADLPRMQIAECADWLIRDHLTELHPMIWAHAADGFDNNTRITSPSRFAARGRADALQVIADLFHDEITRGRRVTFTANGPQVEAIG
ncbi:hypothetical protein [Primorskyibacter sp. S87]|uniref:hypothetical protein n=1 Tax=Primorskyibacter sp. S87 TaxID=3415126 RepID=UPI003C7DA0A4